MPVARTATGGLIARLRSASDDFDAVLSEMRTDPRFAGFMEPPTAESLAARASQGPA
jgi:hypothetical protein